MKLLKPYTERSFSKVVMPFAETSIYRVSTNGEGFAKGMEAAAPRHPDVSVGMSRTIADQPDPDDPDVSVGMSGICPKSK